MASMGSEQSKRRLLLALAAAYDAAHLTGDGDDRSGESAADSAGFEDGEPCTTQTALLLGLQLLLRLGHSRSLSRRLWLLSSGAAHCARSELAGISALCDAHEVELTAMSLAGRSLAALGVPRWLACCSPAAMPELVAQIFSEEPPRPPRGPVRPPSAPLSIELPASIALAPPRQPPRQRIADEADLPHGVYLSGLLDYALAPEPEAAGHPLPAAPTDDALAAFFCKVRAREEVNTSGTQSRCERGCRLPKPRCSNVLAFGPPYYIYICIDACVFMNIIHIDINVYIYQVRSSVELVQTTTRLAWSSRKLNEADGEVMGFVFSSMRPLAHVMNLALENNLLGDKGIAALALALGAGGLINLERLILTGEDEPLARGQLASRGGR